MSDKYELLEKLQGLKEKGILTDTEFQLEKEKLLKGNLSDITSNQRDFFGLEENTYATFIHLSLLLTVFHFFLGILMAFTLWIIYKNKYKNIDNQGRIVFNWVLTILLIIIVLILLLGFFYGNYSLRNLLNFSSISFVFYTYIIMIIGNIVQAIIGGLKANQGKLWRYPLSIPFIKMRK